MKDNIADLFFEIFRFIYLYKTILKEFNKLYLIPCIEKIHKCAIQHIRYNFKKFHKQKIKDL